MSTVTTELTETVVLVLVLVQVEVSDGCVAVIEVEVISVLPLVIFSEGVMVTSTDTEGEFCWKASF